MTNAVPDESLVRRALPFALGIAAGAAWPLSHISEASGDLFFVLGYNMPITVIIWAALYFSLLRKSGWKVGLLFLLTIFATAVLANYAIIAYEKGQIRRMTAGIQNDYDNARTGKPIVRAAPAPGELAPLQALMNELLVESAANRKSYLAEITGSGVLDLLNPDVMATHPIDAKLRVSRAKAAIAKYRNLSAALSADSRQKLANSSLNDSLRAQALQGFDESAPKTRVRVDRVWNDESGILDEIEAISQLLEGSPREWTVRNRKLVFRNAAILAAYNAHVLNIQRIGLDEQAILRQMDQENQARFNAMKTLSN